MRKNRERERERERERDRERERCIGGWGFYHNPSFTRGNKSGSFECTKTHLKKSENNKNLKHFKHSWGNYYGYYNRNLTCETQENLYPS
jgi:hypothetical protein